MHIPTTVCVYVCVCVCVCVWCVCVCGVCVSRYKCVCCSLSYKNFHYQKQTKRRWARDDPAFLVLLSGFLLRKSVLLTNCPRAAILLTKCPWAVVSSNTRMDPLIRGFTLSCSCSPRMFTNLHVLAALSYTLVSED